MKGTCANCGEYTSVHQHHVVGKEIDPDNTVPLCPKCHRQHHIGMLLFDTVPAEQFADWLFDETDAGRFVPFDERDQKLAELGYISDAEKIKPDDWNDKPGKMMQVKL